MAGHIFKKRELESILNNVVGKTLGEVDKNNVFERAKKNKKITGIAGDVIEQSVLGYPADSSQKPDLIVDGKDVELKTTGVRVPKKESENQYEAKEPMSITAVSPEKITNEEFSTSNFWHKLENLLLVYYHYNSKERVDAIGYANFPILGYHFHQFSEEDKEILKNDWIIVRDYIKYLKENYSNPEDFYHKISSELRKDLMLIDIAPKWPNRPRFRLKRSTVSNIVQKYFGEKLEELKTKYYTFKELDEKLHDISKLYEGKTIKQIMNELNIPCKLNKKGDVEKSISEQIFLRMFGATTKKISKIDLFNKIGIIPKTITVTKSGTKKEDSKFFTIDFTEWTDETIKFEDSFAYNYFYNQHFLYIIFQQSSSSKLLDNKFLGFKRIIFPDYIIENDLKKVWFEIRDLINNKKLKETIKFKKDGTPQIAPKTGNVITSINFPKSKDHIFFVRGTGTDSNNKPLEINGIKMYHQELWIHGKYLVELLSKTEFI